MLKGSVETAAMQQDSKPSRQRQASPKQAACQNFHAIAISAICCASRTKGTKAQCGKDWHMFAKCSLKTMGRAKSGLPDVGCDLTIL